jgi:hypothetical protein
MHPAIKCLIERLQVPEGVVAEVVLDESGDAIDGAPLYEHGNRLSDGDRQKDQCVPGDGCERRMVLKAIDRQSENVRLHQRAHSPGEYGAEANRDAKLVATKVREQWSKCLHGFILNS